MRQISARCFFSQEVIGCDSLEKSQTPFYDFHNSGTTHKLYLSTCEQIAWAEPLSDNGQVQPHLLKFPPVAYTYIFLVVACFFFSTIDFCTSFSHRWMNRFRKFQKIVIGKVSIRDGTKPFWRIGYPKNWEYSSNIQTFKNLLATRIVLKKGFPYLRVGILLGPIGIWRQIL